MENDSTSQGCICNVKDFEGDRLVNKDVIERIDVFSEEFYKIGSKLIS